jgi:hypothetical protein
MDKPPIDVARVRAENRISRAAQLVSRHPLAAEKPLPRDTEIALAHREVMFAIVKASIAFMFGQGRSGLAHLRQADIRLAALRARMQREVKEGKV